MTICAATRLLLHLAFAPGSVHDFRLFQQMAAEMPENVKILADSGYQGIENVHECSFSPYKKPKGGELTAFQKRVNEVLAKSRVPVEHVIGELKTFRILGGKYRGCRKRLEFRAVLIAGLVNFNKCCLLTPYF